MAPGSWSVFSSDIVDRILCRVPLPDVLQNVPLVCKQWHQRSTCRVFRRAFELHQGKWLITGQIDSGVCIVLFLFNIKSSKWYKLRLEGLPENATESSTGNYCFAAGGFFGLIKIGNKRSLLGNPLTKQWFDMATDFRGIANCILIPSNRPISNSMYDYNMLAIEFGVTPNYVLNNTVKVYDFTTGKWTEKAIHTKIGTYYRRLDYQLSSGMVYCLNIYVDMGFTFNRERGELIQLKKPVAVGLARYDTNLDEWEEMVTMVPPELDADNPNCAFPSVVQFYGELLLVARMNEHCRPPEREMLNFHNTVSVWKLCNVMWGDLLSPGKNEWEMVSECPRQLMEELVNSSVGDSDLRVCSDEPSGTVWVFMPGSLHMLSFHYPTRKWSLIPGIGHHFLKSFDHIVCSDLSFGATVPEALLC